MIFDKNLTFNKKINLMVLAARSKLGLHGLLLLIHDVAKKNHFILGKKTC